MCIFRRFQTKLLISYCSYILSLSPPSNYHWLQLKDINILDFPTRERHGCFYFKNATPRRDVWACLDFGTILSRVLVTALASAVIVRAQRKAPRFNPVFTSSLQLYLNLYAYLFYGYFSGQSPHAMWYTDKTMLRDPLTPFTSSRVDLPDQVKPCNVHDTKVEVA